MSLRSADIQPGEDISFASDNASGVSARILEALAAANRGAALGYGNDAWTRALEGRFTELFERPVTVLPVATGTAANSIALACMTPPWGAVFCHEQAHIEEDECGAPEFFAGGSKLVPLSGEGGKLKAEDLAQRVGATGLRGVHQMQPAAVSITQATESGRVYSLDEIAAIAEVAHARDLTLHMDGARFANAVARLGCSPAKMTWKAGIDALSFGATKNGAMAAEAVVFFRDDLAETAAFRRKRAGHLFSKMRFLSAQLLAYLEDDHWLENARHANVLARRLGEGLAALPGCVLAEEVEANEVFVRLPEPLALALREKGFVFHDWPGAGPGGRRFVTAFNGRSEDVARFLELATRLTAAEAAAEAAGKPAPS